MQAVTDPARHSHRHQLVGDSYDIRASVDPEQLARAIVDQLFRTRGTLPEHATRNDWYLALAQVVRDRLLDRWVATARTLMQKDVRVVAYLSAEFLVGPHLANNVINLGIERQIREATRLIGSGFRPAGRAGGRAGVGQWRPRPAGRLLPRFPGDAGDSGDRLRHPLRVRHLRSADCRRMAGRSVRQVAGAGQSLGDRAARARVFGGIGRQYRGLARRGGPAPGPLDPGAGRSRDTVRYADRRLSRVDGERAAAVEGRGDRLLRLLRLQRRRLLPRRRAEGRLGKPHQDPLSQRRGARGEAAPARAAVLLRVLFAPGHDRACTSSRVVRSRRWIAGSWRS